MSERPIQIIKGRGTSIRPQARYDRHAREAVDDGWSQPGAKDEWKLTRRVVEILSETRHPLIIVTKSALVERDIDLLAPMAAQGLVSRNCCNYGTHRRHSLLPE